MQFPTNSFDSGGEKGRPDDGQNPAHRDASQILTPEELEALQGVIASPVPEPKRTAADILEEGYWSFQVTTEKLSLTEKFKSLLGYLGDEVPDTLAGLLEISQEKARLRTLLAEQNKPFSVETKFLRRDGAYAPCLFRGWPDDLDPTKMVGTLVRIDSGSSEVSGGLLAEAVEAGFEAFLVLRAVRNGIGDVVDFEIAGLNRKGAELLGVVLPNAYGRLLSDVVPASRESGLAERYAAVMRRGMPVEEEFHVSPGGFQRIWVQRRVVPLSDGVAVFESDISDSRRSSETVERSLRMFERITTTTPDLHAIWDIETRRFIFSNRSLFEMLGYEASRTATVHISAIERILHPEDVQAFHGHLNKLAVQASDNVEQGDFRFRAADGAYRWLTFRDAVFDRHPGGRPKTLLCTAQDVTGIRAHSLALESSMAELAAAREELENRQRVLEGQNIVLEDMAMTDGLTGVKNRRAFEERLSEEVGRASRYNLRLALVIADVDHFKIYNDTYGHPGGDQALKGFAKVLSEVSRDSDSVARIGGEEFALILPNTGAKEAGLLAERIQASLRGTEFGMRGVTASFGCAEMQPVRDAKARLFHDADQACYRSKAEGRNKITVAGQ
ncbi:MAG TPA: diguanylate cyclase [Fimbriimonas sp.]|nr:diguanylate cyclase [Fimbriimonas sp.]